MPPGEGHSIEVSLVAIDHRKFVLLALAGFFAAGQATALPISIEPEAIIESEAVKPETGTSGEGPAMETALAGSSFVDIDTFIANSTLPVQPVAGCTAAGACQAVAVPEPGTWLLLIAGLLGLRLTQRKNG